MVDEAQDLPELVAESFSSSADVYDHSPFFHHCARRLVELAELSPDSRLLDIATGRGAVLFPASEQLQGQGVVVGIDIAEEMIALTAEEVTRRGVANASVRVMDAQAIEFESDVFDRITCGFGLMFMPDLERALAEMNRVLRPGGRVAVSTWSGPGDHGRKYVEMLDELAKESGSTLRALLIHPLRTTAALHEALEAAGFEAIRAIDEAVTVTFANEEEWWEQRMAIPQLYFDRLDTDTQQRFKSEMLDFVRSSKTGDGIPETRIANYAVAAKPS